MSTQCFGSIFIDMNHLKYLRYIWTSLYSHFTVHHCVPCNVSKFPTPVLHKVLLTDSYTTKTLYPIPQRTWHITHQMNRRGRRFLKMSQIRDHQINPSSPHSSSGGAESFRGTPDTRLTTFSPNDGSARSMKPLGPASRSAPATPPANSAIEEPREPASQPDKDPFVTSGQATQLSPTASAFTPFCDFHQDSGSFHASSLSTDIGISRSLLVSASTSITVTEVETWLKVRHIVKGEVLRQN